MLYEQIIERSLIERGWSDDRKYRVMTSDGQAYLLRVSDIERYDAKIQEFNNMQKIASLGLNLCNAVEIGICSEGCYVLYEWIEGQDLLEVIESLPKVQQYQFGIIAGEALRKIHHIPLERRVKFDWAKKFNDKLDQRIDRYLKGAIQYEKGQIFIDYVNQHRHLLEDRPIVFQHGDFHVGNMMLNSDGKLIIIDFDRSDYGDPWEEFNRIVWCMAFPAFASGIIDGYFNREIPLAFWQLLALYIAGNSLGSISWALPYGSRQVAVMIKQAQEILEMYDDMTCEKMIPKWYHSYIIVIKG